MSSEQITIAGTVYNVDRDVAEYTDSTSVAICALTAVRGGTWTLIVRDTIAHGAFVAAGATKLEKMSSAALRAALEPAFGPFPAVVPAAPGYVLAALAVAAGTGEWAEHARTFHTWTAASRQQAIAAAVAGGYATTITAAPGLNLTGKGAAELARHHTA